MAVRLVRAGEQLAEAHDFVGRGTAAAQRGKAVGLIVGGLYSMVSGTGGEILGGAENALAGANCTGLECSREQRLARRGTPHRTRAPRGLLLASTSAAGMPLPDRQRERSYDHDAAGSLTYKSDVGSLDYVDSAHPHAVTWAGGSIYGYDAAGHQTTRPGGMAVEYTTLIRRGRHAGRRLRSFGYDATQQRIRRRPQPRRLLFR
ncbi:MAG: hypothetical protein R3F14_00785 [Polyangiaceae bacterium]